jgi:hypothetical protein
MEFLEDKEQRDATVKSLIIHLLITLFFIFFGLPYLDPRPEDGIAIAFGYDAEAGGEVQVTPAGDVYDSASLRFGPDHQITLSFAPGGAA